MWAGYLHYLAYTIQRNCEGGLLQGGRISLCSVLRDNSFLIVRFTKNFITSSLYRHAVLNKGEHLTLCYCIRGFENDFKILKLKLAEKCI